MQQLNPYKFYELGAKLHALFNGRSQGRVADMFGPLTEAQALLDSFIKGDPIPLETSKADANRLLGRLSAVFNRYFIDPSTKQLKTPVGEDRIDAHELSTLHSLLEKFEHALAAELTRAPNYIAGKRGIYSTFDLVENARLVFSEELRNIIPAATLGEFDAAGRALAFGLGTAASMHMLRAVEVTLKPYYELFAGAATAKGERNYALYLKKLSALAEDEESASRPDKRVVQMLAQVKDHYRNPLISPDTAVSVDEATSLFGLASALISLMAEELQARRQPQGKGAKPARMTSGGEGEDDDDMYDFRMSQTG